MRHYILENRNAVPADLMAWARMMEDPDAKRVALTSIGDARVSTVFLGLDHSFGDGPPLLFETMVLGGPLNEEMERCTTWEQAEAQHEAMCELVRGAQ